MPQSKLQVSPAPQLHILGHGTTIPPPLLELLLLVVLLPELAALAVLLELPWPAPPAPVLLAADAPEPPAPVPVDPEPPHAPTMTAVMTNAPSHLMIRTLLCASRTLEVSSDRRGSSSECTPRRAA